ncbi:negative regulator of flagellin synthesis FlgM [Actimicrobium sp. GrIS 1.19]|uniref:flagellar biosynthesis anti-sigma factor FlgM n=1 Tax=Actimicrobium sp. GrIS 1.19 TaxID=3071708 RepID=UPI002E033F1B|nr:negative regulator of flagellin synthesis FlgM [Actimicrobium sp. GrIS 1.19]
MKIDDSSKKTGSVGVSPTQTRSSKGADQAAAVSNASAGPSGSVKISAQALALGGSSTFDLKKVSEIKAAIASGTFRINPEKIADGLIDTVRDQFAARKEG